MHLLFKMNILGHQVLFLTRSCLLDTINIFQETNGFILENDLLKYEISVFPILQKLISGVK